MGLDFQNFKVLVKHKIMFEIGKVEKMDIWMILKKDSKRI